MLQPRAYHLPELMVAHGLDPVSLARRAADWLESVRTAPERSGFIKQLAAQTRDDFTGRGRTDGFRVSLVAYSERELEKQLGLLLEMITREPEKPFSLPSAGIFYGHGEPLGKTAFLFPGQGAQYLGMGGPLAEAFPAAGRVWETLGALRFGGKTIREMVFPDAAADEPAAKAAFLRLSQADWTNPCIAVVGEAIFTLLSVMGLRPDAVAAHSFGDISAFRAAGILTADEMIRATRYRGELGVACPLATRGCVLVVPEGAEKVLAVLAANRLDQVWIANFNTPRQTVLSGVREAIDQTHAAFTAAGINSRLIPISAAPHCPLAVDVAEKFSGFLADLSFKKANCDVYSFLFGRKVDNDPVLFRKLLKAHIEKPVRFLTQIEQMHHDGIRIFVEIGPSDILTSLVDQILAGKPHLALCTDRKKTDSVLVFLSTTAELFKEGLIRDLTVLQEGYPVAAAGSGRKNQDAGSREQAEKRLKKLDLEIARIRSTPLATVA